MRVGWSVVMDHGRALSVAVRGPGESAVGGLHGRQRQDAAIVGVEVLCVAPRPGNRQ